MDVTEKRELSCFCQESNLGLSIPVLDCCSSSKEFPPFMESEVLSTCPKEPTTLRYAVQTLKQISLKLTLTLPCRLICAEIA
jgi:hypothetical protein